MKMAVGVAAALTMLLAVGALVLRGPSGGGAVENVTLVSDCVQKVEHPLSLIFACGDGNFSVHDIAWTDWGAEESSGSGTAEVNDCTPNCADGKFHTYPIELTAAGRRECGEGNLRYTVVNFSFPGDSPFPAGSPQAQSGAVDFGCSLFP